MLVSTESSQVAIRRKGPSCEKMALLRRRSMPQWVDSFASVSAGDSFQEHFYRSFVGVPGPRIGINPLTIGDGGRIRQCPGGSGERTGTHAA